jgi:glucose-6-phosphate 1-epimerase
VDGTGSSSATTSSAGDLSVKLDFGLGAQGVDSQTRELWPYAFGLVYSVTLNRDSLTTNLVVTNDDTKPFDVQVLMHTYLRVKVSLLPPVSLVERQERDAL